MNLLKAITLCFVISLAGKPSITQAEFSIQQNELVGPVPTKDTNSFITQYELYNIFSFNETESWNGGRIVVVMFDIHSREHKNFVKDTILYPWKSYMKYAERRYKSADTIIVKNYSEMIEAITYNLGAIGYLPKGSVLYNSKHNGIVEVKIR